MDDGSVAIPDEYLLTLVSIVEYVVTMFYMPNLDLVVHRDAAAVYTDNHPKFELIVEKYIENSNTLFTEKIETLNDIKDNLKRFWTQFRTQNRWT